MSIPVTVSLCCATLSFNLYSQHLRPSYHISPLYNYSLAHSQIETNLLFDRADVLTSDGDWATLTVLFTFASFIFIKSRAK
jgi:hypothetical protein